MSARAMVMAAVLLAGCATKPPLVETRGSAPPGAGAFRISSVSPDAPPRAEQLVADGLRARGLRVAGAEEVTTYAVQVSFADHAPQVGAYVPDAAGAPAWRVRGQKKTVWPTRTKGVYSLGIHIVEAATGREAFDVRVSQPHRKAAPDTALPSLVAAALKPAPGARP